MGEWDEHVDCGIVKTKRSKEMLKTLRTGCDFRWTTPHTPIVGAHGRGTFGGDRLWPESDHGGQARG